MLKPDSARRVIEADQKETRKGIQMIFKLHKINVAPAGTGLKDYQVSIQLAEHGTDADGRILLASSCRSKDDLDYQIERCIRDLRKLRFPE
jgi:hypothetical protein